MSRLKKVCDNQYPIILVLYEGQDSLCKLKSMQDARTNRNMFKINMSPLK